MSNAITSVIINYYLLMCIFINEIKRKELFSLTLNIIANLALQQIKEQTN